MVRTIALKGRLSGSAVLRSTSGRTEIILKTRQMSVCTTENGLSAVLIAPTASGSFRFAAAELKNGAGSAQIDDARGIIIKCGDETLCEGASGLSEAAFDSAKVQLRLQHSGAFTEPSGKHAAGADRLDTNVSSSAQSEPTKALNSVNQANRSGNALGESQMQSPEQARQTASPVTKRILSQAKALFGENAGIGINEVISEMDEEASHASALPFDDVKMKDRSSAAKPALPGSEAIKNPFPRLFPNSSWRREADEQILRGKAKLRGKLYSIEAYPREVGFPAAKAGSLRRAVSADGKAYWLIINRM
ncbi:MAG: hypothetical protein IKI64_09645 [Clostridia bacterium]|nr:hypothetical protein [Clostridia bacterium]